MEGNEGIVEGRGLGRFNETLFGIIIIIIIIIILFIYFYFF